MGAARVLLGVLVLVSVAVGCRGGEAEPGLSGARAFEHVRAQVELGPRPAGSEAAARTRDYLRQHLEALGYAVEERLFEARTPKGPVSMVNLLARRPGEVPESLVLAAHYDTKRFDEFEFVGANDGASGVGVLLELARVFAAQPLKRELVLLFLDGEEAVGEWSAVDGKYGSRQLAGEWKRSGEAARVRALFVLDMVGDRNLLVTRDLHSHPQLQELLVQEARRLGHGPMFSGPPQGVDDDHVSFALVGIPSLDVIGFNTVSGTTYPPYWHTKDDTLDKVSAESLEAVGKVVEATLRRLDAILQAP